VTNISDQPKSLPQWLAYIEALHPKSIEMGLDRVRVVAERLALHPTFPIISIAGTNGKGSTCGMLENVYLQAGYRVGAYASPHFVRYNERVRVNLQEIDDDALCRAFEAVEQARQEVVLTYFEMGTLAAMWHFLQSDLDLAILEVGMGGRLDAVNVFEPTCAIVTSIDLDHMDYLGDTREKIGAEKAGIFRQGKRAICGEPDTPKSIIDYAEKIGADLHLINRDFSVEQQANSWQYHAQAGASLTMPPLALEGDFQLNNAACAVSAIQYLNGMLPVPEAVLKTALSSVSLLGRFYVFSEQPMVILDVAHNPQAAKSLAKNLRKKACAGKTYAVFAIANNGQTQCFERVDLALDAACIDAGKNDRIIVFGSFYTVADAIEFLRE